jgi:N-formylglutamate amidohydrolase
MPFVPTDAAREAPAPFSILRPDRLASPFVFNSPHSGSDYPAELLDATRLDAATLRKSEDAFVDELFAACVARGAPLLRAHFPRAWLDVNREAYELDPRLIDGAMPDFANTQSVRVVGGLGTIPRIVTESEEIYRDRLPLAAAIERIERHYLPYHEALSRLIDDAIEAFGLAILIDCHSMPSNAIGETQGSRPDFVLGDRYGSACAPDLTRAATRELRAMGYRVSLNKPYAGGFITEHYGRPAKARHALQIEINRALYMDEAAYAKSPGFALLVMKLERLMDGLMSVAPHLLRPPRAAAE